jgi:hypothetical protein
MSLRGEGFSDEMIFLLESLKCSPLAALRLELRADVRHEAERPLPAVDDAAEVLGRLAVGGAPCFCVVLGKDLRSVTLALGDHADVEAGVEQLA